MAKFTLVRIETNGRRSYVTDSYEPDSLRETGELFLKKYPGTEFGVTDERGFFVWPEKLAKAHVNPEKFDPLVKQEYE